MKLSLASFIQMSFLRSLMDYVSIILTFYLEVAFHHRNTQLVYLLPVEHLHNFQFLANENKATMDPRIQVFVRTYVFLSLKSLGVQ